MIFVGHNKFPKIMKFVFPLSYTVNSPYKNFEAIWTKLNLYLFYAYLFNYYSMNFVG